jgi:intracellular septation protein
MPPPPPQKKRVLLQLLFGGLLPVIAFTLIEENYGTWWGLIAGLTFGVGEILYELIRHRKVSSFTWFGNGLLIVMGIISLITNEGVWFKMQPAIFEAVFALALWISLIRRKNLLVWISEMQGSAFPPQLRPHLDGLCFRLGLFFAVQAAIATYAAFYWSTEAWAYLKGFGILIGMTLYMALEFIIMRWRLKR